MSEPRELENQLYPLLGNPKILVILGGRFVGKTSLVQNIRRGLRQKGRISESIDLENLKYLMKLEKNFRHLTKLAGPVVEKSGVLFLEEIQNFTRPLEFLQYIDRQYRGRCKVVITASFDKFGDSLSRLADRLDVLRLYPLNFREFLRFKKRKDILDKLNESPVSGMISKKDPPADLIPDIRQLLEEYIRFGGYPAVVMETGEERKIEILEEIYNTFLLKDVEKKRIHNKPKLYSMVRTIAENTGTPLNQNGIASSLGLSITAVENYLSIVERAFFVEKVRPFFRNFGKEIRKMPKMYFRDSGIRNLILERFEAPEERMDKEGYYENIVYNFLEANPRVREINYWRTQTKHEVDFILNETSALEVEFNGNMVKPSKYKQFFKNYPDFPFQVTSYINPRPSDYSLLDLI